MFNAFTEMIKTNQNVFQWIKMGIAKYVQGNAIMWFIKMINMKGSKEKLLKAKQIKH